VKIIGNLLLNLHIDLAELIDEYTEKLMDNDWRVKLNVINTLSTIIDQDFEKITKIEPLFSMIIVNLRDKDEDVARSSAELLKTFATYYLSKEKTFYILLNLLYNEKPRVKELVIWMIGEIGKEKSSEVISVIPKLVTFLKNSGYRIQIKVIEALVSIAENNFEQIWSNLLTKILDTEDEEYRDSLGNALYHLSQEYINKIFPYLFNEMENPSKNIRNVIFLVFQRLYEEYKVEIENEITKIIYNLESKYWRERKNTVILLQNLSFILENKKFAVWITIEFNNALKIENDHDVKEELINSLKKIERQYPGIEELIKKIEQEISYFEEEIQDFQKVPARFRKVLNSYIQKFQFNETEVQLNKRYDEILEKIRKFNQRINNFEYKRLAFDLIEDWEETKYQIIDELSIIKSFIIELCDEKRNEFEVKLKNEIELLEDKIDILKTQFEFLKKNSFNKLDFREIISSKDEDLQQKFDHLSLIRRSLFKMDVEIRDLLIGNSEFDEMFKDLLRKWVATKIDIQMFLNDLDREIKNLREDIVENLTIDEEHDVKSRESKIASIDSDLALQILQTNIQSIVSHGIDGFKKFNTNFDILKQKFGLLVDRSEFNQAKKLLEMQSSQILSFIDETERQLDNILGNKNLFQDEKDLFNIYLRPYLEKWNNSKELLINKSKKFIRKSQDKLYLHQIKHYLKMMNPIKIDLLSNYMNLDYDELKEKILNFVNTNKLDAKITEDSLHSKKIERDFLSLEDLNLYKNIKTLGNKLYLNFKLNNPSTFDFTNIQIRLKAPSYLKIVKKESFPEFITLDDLKGGNFFKFRYIFKIDKIIHKNLSDPRADEIKLSLFYKDPFNMKRKLTKNINLLLP